MRKANEWWVFAPIGVLMMLGAVLIHIDRLVEQEKMIKTVGEVMSVTQDGCITVQFMTNRQQAVQFNGSLCEQPPGFQTGEWVPVLYDPSRPAAARINTFLHNWLATLLLGIVGAVFTLVGAVVASLITLGAHRAAKRADRLKRSGRSILARVMSVERNMSANFNGRSPWQIVAQWQNPTTGKLHFFHSHDLWYDPSPYLIKREVRVWINPEKPDEHALDTSFLPLVA